MFTSMPKMKNILLADVLLILGASISILWSLQFSRIIVSMPYQLGFREGTSQVLTYLLLNGENPYVFDNQPLGYNVYSITYNAVVLPFAVVFGNTLRVHRIVAFIFIVLSTLMGFQVVYTIRQKFSLALTCGAFLMIGFIGWGGIGSAPTAMGVFLFLAAVFIPFLKSFDNNSLILGALLALIAFYTKAYFVLSFGIVASYLFLFVTKKKGMIYTLFFLVLLLITFVVVRIIFPLYFIDLIWGNLSNTFTTFNHLSAQLAALSSYFFPILFLTLLMILDDFSKRERNSSSKQALSGSFNLSHWDRPLLEIPMNYSLYTFLCTFLIFLFVLGSHVGNYLRYAYEMMVPAFLFWFFGKFEFGKKFGIIPAALVIFNLFSWQYITLNPEMLRQTDSVEWRKLYSYLEPSMYVLNSSTITSRLVELGSVPIDSGQTNYYYSMEPYPNIPFIGPSYNEFYTYGMKYMTSINDSIKKQEFDLIVTTKDVDIFYDLKLIARYYQSVNQIVLLMPQTNQKWVVQVWEPK